LKLTFSGDGETLSELINTPWQNQMLFDLIITSCRKRFEWTRFA
jgi:hypothetical protein